MKDLSDREASLRTRLAELELEYERATVRAPYDGIVSDVAVTEGDQVTKDQLLVQIEPEIYMARVQESRAAELTAKANLDLVGLRPLCPTGEIRQLFDMLKDGQIDTYKDWKGRYKQNLDKMKTGELLEVAQVLKNLRLVSAKKSLSFREKKMLDKARHMLIMEISISRSAREEEAIGLLQEALHLAVAADEDRERVLEHEAVGPLLVNEGVACPAAALDGRQCKGSAGTHVVVPVDLGQGIEVGPADPPVKVIGPVPQGTLGSTIGGKQEARAADPMKTVANLRPARQENVE